MSQVPAVSRPTKISLPSTFQNVHWTGLGGALPENASIDELLRAANLDWNVIGIRPRYTINGAERESSRGQLVVRLPRVGVDELPTELALVGNEWRPVQNREMFEVAALARDTGMKFESAGMVLGGRHVLAFLSSDTFSVDGTRGDDVQRGLLMTMGHDGKLPLRATPYTIRKICTNGLRMAFRANERGWFAVLHKGNLDGCLESMKKVIAGYTKIGQRFQEDAGVFNRKIMRADDLKQFWGRAWELVHGDRPLDESRVKDTRETIEAWTTTMEIERLELGMNEPTLWLAANAVTSWIQHRPAGKNLKNVERAADRRMYSNILGENARLASAVFTVAAAII